MTGLLLPALLSAGHAQTVVLHAPPRDFGYFLGDVLTMTAEIRMPPGAVLDTRSLPSPGPVSTWIELRDVRARGGAGGRWLIRVAYQAFYDPPEAAAIVLPGYSVAFTEGTARVPVSVPGWRFMVSPFRHELLPVMDPAALRGSHPPVFVATPGAWARLLGGGAVSVLALAVLAARLGLLPAMPWRRAPFARAVRDVAGLAARDDRTARVAALLALHRAFDATAGRRLLADDVGSFLLAHPRFAARREAIGLFFDGSRQCFFGLEGEAAAWPVARLLQFGRELARVERTA